MPVLAAAQGRWRTSNVEIIGVAMDAQGWSKVTPFLQENPVDYEILLGNPRVARQFRVGRVYPTTVFVAPDGDIIGSISAALEASDLDRMITSLLRELQQIPPVPEQIRNGSTKSTSNPKKY